jgi:hypothetical protein
MDTTKQSINKIINLIDSIDLLSIETEIDDLLLNHDNDDLETAKDGLTTMECSINETIDFLTLAKKTLC